MESKKRSIVILSFVIGLLLFGSSVILAQDDMSNKDKMDKKEMNSKMMMSDDDKEFAKMAAMDNAAEIKMARLAMQRSNNKEVKDFAKMIAKDHSKASKDLGKILKGSNMMMPNALGEEQMEAYNKLNAATGAALQGGTRT